MTRAAWHLEPQVSTLLAATLWLLGLVLAASLTVGVVELMARRLPRISRPRPRRTAAPAPRFYVGRLQRFERCVFVVDSAVRPLAPAGRGRFGWGSAGPGGRQLARSVLRDAGRADPAPEQVERFVGDVVSRLPDDGFVLAADQVQRWLGAQRRRSLRGAGLVEQRER